MSDIERSEALKELKEYVEGLDMEYATPFDKAILFAIASLETDEAYNLMYEQPEFCADCISRKNILESLNGAFPSTDWNKALFRKIVMDSPSVLPNATKNDLGVDRKQLKTMIRGLTKWYVKRDNTEVGEPNTAVGLLYDDVMFGIDRLPSVTPQEPKIRHCKNCKFFELNSWAACGGIPIIVAHEICKAWGEGCKTKIDGYCFLFEPKESEG